MVKSKFQLLKHIKAYIDNPEVKIIVPSIEAYNELCKYIPKDNVVFADKIQGMNIDYMWIDEDFV